MLRRLLLSAALLGPALADDLASRDEIPALMNQRRWPEAQTALEEITAAEPANAEAWNTLGAIHLAQQHPGESVAAYEKAVALQPDNSTYHLQLGHALGLAAMKAGLFSKMGFAKKCKAAYDRAVELDPKSINARWSLMEYCRQAPGIVGGGMDQAYAQAAEIKKLDARRGRSAYASLYSSEKKYPEAFALYDEVLREQPGEPDALYNIGRLAAQSGEQLDRGVASLRELLTHEGKSTDARIHALIGNILEKKGDKPGAQSAYEAAIAADPKNTRALEALRKLKQG